MLLTILADVSSVADAVVEEVSRPSKMVSIIRAAFIAGVGIPVAFIFSRFLGKQLTKSAGQHIGQLSRKVSLFAGMSAVLVTIMLEFGFKLGGVLGAAGIASVAIGFASQTSLSNIISGLFLYTEKPFEIGDVIKVGDTMGVVLSIDLLSVKLRQFDNQFVRIPNESMIKTQVTNITKFPIRRLDVNVGVSYGTDVEKVIRALKEVADSNPFSLDEPGPVIIFQNFGDSSLNFMIGAWCDRTQFLDLKNSLMRDIKAKFDKEGIEIPFPQRVVHMVKEQ